MTKNLIILPFSLLNYTLDHRIMVKSWNGFNLLGDYGVVFKSSLFYCPFWVFFFLLLFLWKKQTSIASSWMFYDIARPYRHKQMLILAMVNGLPSITNAYISPFYSWILWQWSLPFVSFDMRDMHGTHGKWLPHLLK